MLGEATCYILLSEACPGWPFNRKGKMLGFVHTMLLPSDGAKCCQARKVLHLAQAALSAVPEEFVHHNELVKPPCLVDSMKLQAHRGMVWLRQLLEFVTGL